MEGEIEMSRNIAVVLVGIGGYGNIYLEDLLEQGQKEGVQIVGAVDPQPQGCRYLEQIKKLGIPVYDSLEDFYAQSKADLAIISSPIQFHCQQTCLALFHGSHVLCEKPVAATIQEVRQMEEARNQAGLFVDIGYQWSHSPVIQSLKYDIQQGVLGQPKRLKTIVLWARDQNYFNRAAWAGKKRDAKGNWILDSVANNATAHYLHNMFYVLGEQINQSVRLAEVMAELYRANPIENFDTAAIRAKTNEGTEILFLATHAVDVHPSPQFCYEFEKADVVYVDPNIPQSQENIVALFHDGRVNTYGNPNKNDTRKMWMAVEAIRGDSKIICGLEAASSHTICINAAQESMPKIIDFPTSFIRRNEEREITWVEGLKETFRTCFVQGKLPSELDAPWAKSAKKINVEKYNFFRGDGIE